jgi:hypothetical protein
MPGVSEHAQKHRLTARLTSSARIEILMDALAPKRLQIMSWHKNETQLTTKPQSSARYGRLMSSLLASRFIMMTLTKNSETVAAGMLRNRTL